MTSEMKPVTFAIDDETDRLARAAAEAAGVSYGRRLQERLAPALRQQLAEERPSQVRRLVGCSPDFPLRDPSFS